MLLGDLQGDYQPSVIFLQKLKLSLCGLRDSVHRHPNRGILGYGSSNLYTNEVTRAYQKSEIASVKLGKFFSSYRRKNKW